MVDEATIIDLRRASARERKARSRAKQIKEFRAAKRRIWEREAAATIIDLRRASARERMARCRSKMKEAKQGTTIAFMALGVSASTLFGVFGGCGGGGVSDRILPSTFTRFS